MSLAFKTLLLPAAGRPEAPVTPDTASTLNIFVVFTSGPATMSALRKAGALASRLGARVTLVIPQVVPYPLPLTSPPVLLDFSEARFREIARESPVETAVHLYLCRDSSETLRGVLKPHSLIVIGGRRRWWPTREERLAKKLRGAGHEVIFAELV